MPEELRPCPFYGGVAKVMNNYWVRCKDCEDDCFLENVQLKDIQLMAAAPEMLELLRKAWLEMDNAVQTYIPVCKDGEDMAELCGKIETLIDRIDGEGGTNA